MNSKAVIILALAGVVGLVYSQGDFCSTCQTIAQNIKTEHNYDYTGYTEDDLVKDVDTQCDNYYTGIEDSLCKSIIKQNKAKLYNDLLDNASNQQCCHDALPDLGC